MAMKSSNGKSRIWARRDRTIVTPQRTLASQMRKTPTVAERKLWWHLRHRLKTPATHFRRQVRIAHYIVDFASHKPRLVVEVDGGQHVSNALEDQQRTTLLESHGYRVLRFWNNDVLANIDGVLTEILRAVTTTPTPNPSPQGGGEQNAPTVPLQGRVKNGPDTSPQYGREQKAVVKEKHA